MQYGTVFGRNKTKQIDSAEFGELYVGLLQDLHRRDKELRCYFTC